MRSFFVLFCAAVLGGATEGVNDSPQPECSSEETCPDGASAAEDVDEAELMRVSLLQGAVKFPRTALTKEAAPAPVAQTVASPPRAEAPAATAAELPVPSSPQDVPERRFRPRKGADHRSTAILAEGQVDSSPAAPEPSAAEVDSSPAAPEPSAAEANSSATPPERSAAEAQRADHHSTAVLAEGAVDSSVKAQQPSAAKESQGRHSAAMAASWARAAAVAAGGAAAGGGPWPEATEGNQASPQLAPEEEAAEEATGVVASFVQTGLELEVGKATDANASMLQLADQTEVFLGEGCSFSLTTLSMSIELETLRAMGAFPRRSPCTTTQNASQFQAVALTQQSNRFLPRGRELDRTIILGYIMFYFVCVSYMFYGLVYPPKLGSRGVQYTTKGRKVVTDIDVEEETWRSSWLGWLGCSWASAWVARWGHSLDAALTKIKADELPQLGSRDIQAYECSGDFKKLWQEEVDARGEQASVFTVIMQVWTKRLMVALMLIAACQQTIGQLYAVALIEHGLKYFYWLQKEQAFNPDKYIPMAVPLLMSIVLFSALPFLNCIFSSISNNIARKMDQRLSGAMSIAVFEKAQRLPSHMLHSSVTKNKETGKEEEVPPQVDMMQLIGYDINGNIMGSYFQLCFCINSFVAVVVFTNMLWARLRLATLIAFGVSIPVIISLGVISGQMAKHGYHLQMVSDQRIRTLRELLWGIRVVKSYAWEDAAEKRITDYRNVELSILETYWYYIGLVMGVTMTFPRLLVIAALWGFAEMYGTHDVSNIFVCMQLLGSLKASCEGLASSLARAILIQPSLQRIEAFLKMAEAPVLLPHRKPDWVDMWPPTSKGPAQENGHPPAELAIQGSYAWTDDGLSVLHDLDLRVQKGDMIAILGRVGSGKSTLLQAILGELYPDLSKKTYLSRPEIVAYCSQVPHIGEGTLRENVLFGQDLDTERYNEAIAGASLEADLKVLPGGDSVCIGSRGITLSGGQKARVALARAAYHRGSDLLLVDDPFGAVDAPTAMTLLNRLLLGPLMQGRTRVVVLQPDSERLRVFDHVAILEGGAIVEQGTPEEVMKTAAYSSLLSSTSRDFTSMSVDVPGETQMAVASKKEDNRAMRVKLREEDFEGRPTLDMVKQYCRIGRWRNIFNTSILYSVQVFIWLLADLVLANWTNSIAQKLNISDRSFIMAYFFWLFVGVFLWLIVWKFGMWFTLRISQKILGMMLSKLLRAPIDKFFDKHPIGRIMNRMVSDVATVDFSLFLRSTGTLATIYQTLVPLFYIHFIIPWFITILAIPVYYLIWQLCKRYWNTTVPLRYCATNSRSDVNSFIADVAANNTVIRAYGDQERITRGMCDALDDQLKAGLYGERILRRWLVNRILFLWSFYMTTTYMVGMMNTRWMGAGTLGLCLANLMLIEALLEPNLDHATGAQLEFIALARIHEYMNIPQEKPMHYDTDAKYKSFLARMPRAWLGKLKSVGQGDKAEVFRDGRLLLKASSVTAGLVAADGLTLQDLCPRNAQLKETEPWHHIICVNEVSGDVDAMVEELCGNQAGGLMLEVQSGWLAGGARVVVENLKAGYADIPRDVLKGINVTFEPKMKVSIVGTTGCGKSSLLLVLLRLLEPRAGRVLINGVDTRDVGLATLRRSLGMVPQDPVLFSGNLRHNLDPFGVYSESSLWRALELAHLTDLVKSWPAKMDYQITEEGANLSFGQRQLLCLARMVLRQPPLLLLDEATSAIDPRTQEEVQNTIITAFPNSTLVAIAHRLETILDFDFVCVMERGEVIEQGAVKEVSQRKGGRLRKMLEAKRVW